MRSLWLKDRPWMWGFALVGLISITLAVAERGFVTLFVLGPHRLEMAYWAAGIAGLLLGAVAVLWDDLLGTREFLMQRPVGARSLSRSPIAACLVVVASWVILAPPLSWALAAFDSGIFNLTFWAGLPEILATLQFAWPMCAVGCVAAAFPAPWWLRLLLACSLVTAVAMGLDLGTQNVSGVVSPAVFTMACLIVAAVLFAVATLLNAQRVDSDRPWSASTRLVAGSTLVASMAYTLLALVGEAESHAVRSVTWEYPRVVEVDSTLRLATRTDDWRKLAVADANHVAIGEPRPMSDFAGLDYGPERIRELLEIEAPRFHQSSGGRVSYMASGRFGTVLLDRTGRAWHQQQLSSGVYRTGIGAEHADFPAELRPRSLDDVGDEPNRTAVIVGDRQSGQLWRFDRDLGYFVEWPLPNSDRFDFVSSISGSDAQSAALSGSPLLAAALERDHGFRYISGAAGSYLLKNGVLLEVEVPENKTNQHSSKKAVTLGDDPLLYAVEVAARDGVAGFRHDFEPRTAAERLYAAGAMALTVVRPPLTQLASSVLADDHTEADVWVDRLVTGGKRVWLLLVGFAVAVVFALLARRRLRRIGASNAVCRFWTTVSLLVGPIAALLAVVCESARNHARPAVVAPPVPRIVSITEKKEIRA